MKKIYQAPSTNAILVKLQPMLTDSLQVNKETGNAVGTNDILSREANPSFNAWGDDDEEEY